MSQPVLGMSWLLICCMCITSSVWAFEDKRQELPLVNPVKFEHYAPAPGYSEGPTWTKGEVYFCSGALLRVDSQRNVHKFLEIGPAGTFLKSDGTILICDNKNKALLQLTPENKVQVLAERFENQTLRSLNDLTVDERGNIYWTDPEGSTPEKPVGSIYRLRPDGRVDRVATGLAFPNGLEVDPASKFLYVIESQSKKILKYNLPSDGELLGVPSPFFDLGGSGGDGCAFDQNGNLWVADFHRPETGTGRITILSPEAKILGQLPIPSKLVSNITFGGPNHDEIFCTTGEPAGVFHAKVGVKGFRGHPGKPGVTVRDLNVVPLYPHADADIVRQLANLAKDSTTSAGIPPAIQIKMQLLTNTVADEALRKKLEGFLPQFNLAAIQYHSDQKLSAEIKRLSGKVSLEVVAPNWLRSIAGDEVLGVFGRIAEIELNEHTDGHAVQIPRKKEDRVTDDWLKRLEGQTHLKRLELSGTAVTSSGLRHLKDLTELERLNLCLTAVDDRGFEHLAGMTRMKRMTICSSRITGTGFQHLTAMKELESINLHSSPASDAGLAAIGKLTSLKRLEIVHTQVTDVGLAHLAGLVNLRQLHIHGPEATTAALPFLNRLQNLEQLDVYDKAASNETLVQISQLPKLRSLMLPNGVFTDQGMNALIKVATLEEFSFDSPNVTDASVETLSTLKRLRKLHIGGCQMTESGRIKVKQALPKTTVTP